jgi:hypothetical protein
MSSDNVMPAPAPTPAPPPAPTGLVSNPSSIYADLIKNVGDELTDEVLKVLTSQCLSLLQSVRRVETLCLTSYNNATAGLAMIQSSQNPGIPGIP